MPAAAHQVFVSHVAYGHARPLLALGLNLLAMHPHLHITYIAARQLESKLLPQVSRSGSSEDVLSRFHLVFFGDVANKEGAGLIKVLDLADFVDQTLANWTDAYPKLLKGEPLLDSRTNTLIPTFAAPITRIVSDILVVVGVSPIKTAVESAISLPADKRRISLVSSAPLSSSFVAAYFFNAPHGIIPDIFTRCLEVSGQPGNTKSGPEIYNEIAEQNDDLVQIIGAGDVYMYELQPSSARWRSNVGWLEVMSALIKVHMDRSAIDGCICVWEGELLPQIAEIAKGTFNNFWEVGPQLSPAEWDACDENAAASKRRGSDGSSVGEFAVEDRRGEALEFLDRAREEEGENSVLVISFGSLFAIPTLTHIQVLLTTLVELKIRFIFARGVCSDEIIAEVQRQCLASGNRGLLSTWIPQNAVLAHPATSFFLTHCGSNSVQEAILHSVPMIAWPGAVDQVTIALELSTVHEIAFELLQVRTEYNIGRKTARGPVVVGTPEAMREEMVDVFTKMQGAEGQEMRKRVKAMREVMVRSCRTEGGRSYEAMKSLGL